MVGVVHKVHGAAPDAPQQRPTFPVFLREVRHVCAHRGCGAALRHRDVRLLLLIDVVSVFTHRTTPRVF